MLNTTRCELSAESCGVSCLDEDKVRGNIVLCNTYEGSELEALRAGALGAILQSDSTTLPSIPPIFSLSGSIFSQEDYDSIINYYSNTR